MSDVTVYVLVGPTDYEEMGICAVFLEPEDADRAVRKASKYYGVDAVPEQYRVVELATGRLLDGVLDELLGLE